MGGADNATKGLGLPRVKLSTMDDLNDVLASGQMAGDYKEKHVGLIVYNVSEGCSNEQSFHSSTFVWNGVKWEDIKVVGKDPKESETATTLTDRDGNVYPIASFGNAGVWMTQNLRTKTAPGGVRLANSIMKVSGGLSSYRNYVYPGPGATVISSQGTDATTFNAHPEYGLLYNWHAATNNKNCKTPDQGQIAGAVAGDDEVEKSLGYVQGICPAGWHLPSDREWNLLEKEMTESGASYATGYTNSTWSDSWETSTGTRGIHGEAMKSSTQVINPDVSLLPLGKSNAADATPAGTDIYMTSGADQYTQYSFGSYAYFWTSSQSSSSNAYNRLFRPGGTTNAKGVSRNTTLKNQLFSVRCKKDGT